MVSSHNQKQDNLPSKNEDVGAQSLEEVSVSVPGVYHAILLLKLHFLHNHEVLKSKPYCESRDYEEYDWHSHQREHIRECLSTFPLSSEAAGEWLLEGHHCRHAKLNVSLEEEDHEAVPEDLSIEFVSPILESFVGTTTNNHGEKTDDEALEPDVEEEENHRPRVEDEVASVISQVVQLVVVRLLVFLIKLKEDLCRNAGWNEVKGDKWHQNFEEEADIGWEVDRQSRQNENHLQRGNHPQELAYETGEEEVHPDLNNGHCGSS